RRLREAHPVSGPRPSCRAFPVDAKARDAAAAARVRGHHGMTRLRPRPDPARPISTPELCDRYGRLYTAPVTDVLDHPGRYTQTLPHDIVGLTPSTRVAGLAFPAAGRPSRKPDPERAIRAFLTMLGAVPRDAVLVVKSSDDVSAHFGELSAVAMKARGVRGVVIDGATRDAEYIVKERFPVFCRYRTPLDSLPRWRVAEWGRPVTIGGARVAPGDGVGGDVAGVGVVPGALAEPVLLECERLLSTENRVRDAVRKGMAPLAAYDKFGVF